MNHLGLPINVEPPGPGSAYSDNLLDISDCVAHLLSSNWWIEREHVERSDGCLTWMVTCSRDGQRFVAEGHSPLRAYQQAISLGASGEVGP